ncbi:site-specific integrase [Brevibacillus centrosporus]|nr:site-specific integrase [Brevibacillus centrosporus]
MQMKVHKDEKTGTYWFVVSAGNDELGKRRQIKRRGFRTEKQALKEMRKILQQIDENTYIKNTKLVYSEFLEGEWLDSKALKLKPVTLATYKHNIQKHIAVYFKKVEIGKITPQMIEKFYVHLVKEKGLSEITVLGSNLYMAYLLALTTGMRQGEILGLRWKDIVFENGTLQVRQTLSHDGKHFSEATKTKSSTRTITLTEKTIEELKAHKKKVAKEKLATGSSYQDYNLVVCTKMGNPINPRNLLRDFYRLMKKAIVPKIKFQGLRHTVATLMLTQGINPKIVNEILWHSDIRVTLDTYSHVLPTVHKETAKQFGNMLFG